MTSPPNADLLSRAARALRDEANSEAELDGPSAVGAWQGMHGWHDVSRDVQRAARRRRVALIAGLQLVAAVVGVGAWAAVSGRLPALFSPRPSSVRPPAPVPAYHARARRPAPVPDEPPAPPEAPEPAVDVAVPVSPPRPARPARQPEQAAGTSLALREPALAPAPVPAVVPAPAFDPDEVYRQAHRAHFVRRDYAAALALWEQYLAAGGGSLTIEARYNRAIALVRLHRDAEAIAALSPFAAGEPDGYRQQEAQALMRMLASPPAAPP